MSEYREALQSLIDDINFFCPKKFNGVQSFTDAKALLARGEPDKQGDLLRLLALRGYKIDEADEIARLVFSSEPAAAEKARERNIAIAICHATTDNCVMVDDPERPECTHENCAAMKALKGCSEVKPSPPAAKAEAEKARELFTREEWTEKDGEVLWWHFPIEESPHIGSPLDDYWGIWSHDWYTHWTRIPMPSPPAATGDAP